jgi:hypothetical protein
MLKPGLDWLPVFLLCTIPQHFAMASSGEFTRTAYENPSAALQVDICNKGEHDE